jgi:hypothetical protein
MQLLYNDLSAYLAFPDGGTSSSKPITSSSYTFRISDDYNVNEEDNEYVFGHVIYRQKKDDTVQRGYVMVCSNIAININFNRKVW